MNVFLPTLCQINLSHGVGWTMEHLLLLLPLAAAQYDPAPAWDSACAKSFKELGVYANFSPAVAHVVHAITVEDVKNFFGVELGEENGIPNANTDLTAGADDIVLPNAPSRPGHPGIMSPGFYTFTETMAHMDDPNFGMKENVLARLAHNFHMHEMWTKVRAEADNFTSNQVPASVCDCALDADGSGINDYLTAIFLYFRDVFNQNPGGRPKGNGKTRRMNGFSGYSFRYVYCIVLALYEMYYIILSATVAIADGWLLRPSPPCPAGVTGKGEYLIYVH